MEDGTKLNPVISLEENLLSRGFTKKVHSKTANAVTRTSFIKEFPIAGVEAKICLSVYVISDSDTCSIQGIIADDEVTDDFLFDCDAKTYDDVIGIMRKCVKQAHEVAVKKVLALAEIALEDI